MKRTNKKAFTIVELVIVIAIIAILAAVLIPTFSSLISTSKMSADTQLAKNMNTALAIAEVEDGQNPTFSDAIADIQSAGYTVDKLTPTAEDCHLLWDQDTDRIVFVDANGELLYSEGGVVNAKTYHLWKVAHKAEDMTGGYSYYLADNFTGSIPAIITAGIDVGIKTISAINYTRAATDPAQDVIIRTNGGTLTVNAPADTVRHYDLAYQVNIEAVYSESYHENGEAGAITVNEGNVVLEQTAKVVAIIAAPANGKTVTVDTTKVQEEQKPTVYVPDNTIVEVKGATTDSYTNENIDEVISNASESVKPAASIGNVNYKTIQEAITAAEENSTIKVLKDITYTETNCQVETNVFSAIHINKSLTLDFDNHEMVLNDSIDKNGDRRDAAAISIENTSSEITVKVLNGTVIANNGCCGIFASTNAMLTLDNMKVYQKGGENTISQKAWRLSAVQNSTSPEVTITIIGKNSVYEGVVHAIINKAGSGATIIKDGTFNSTYGTKVISGETISTIAKDWGSSKIQIDGGTFNATNENLAIHTTYGDDNSVTITGGIFNAPLQSQYSKVLITGGTFKKTLLPNKGGHLGYYSITGGTFTAEDPSKINVNNSNTSNCTVTGDVSGTGPWTVTKTIN